MSQFFTILTRSGAAALANGMALGQAVHITSFQVGDGGGAAYEPTLEQLKASTALVNPVYTGAINELKQDPENSARYYIEGVVPVNKGGWTVREVGWFLENGEMFAVTKFPPSYKSIPADGAATELPIRTYLAIGSDANVTLKIDPTVVLATHGYVINYCKQLPYMADTALDEGEPNQLLVKTVNGFSWRNPAIDGETKLQPWGNYLLHDSNEYLLPPSAQLTAGVQVILSKLHAATPILTADCNIICNEQTATQALYNINCAITATFNGEGWEI